MRILLGPRKVPKRDRWRLNFGAPGGESARSAERNSRGARIEIAPRPLRPSSAGSSWRGDAPSSIRIQVLQKSVPPHARSGCAALNNTVVEAAFAARVRVQRSRSANGCCRFTLDAPRRRGELQCAGSFAARSLHRQHIPRPPPLRKRALGRHSRSAGAPCCRGTDESTLSGGVLENLALDPQLAKAEEQFQFEAPRLISSPTAPTPARRAEIQPHGHA